jgi:hypothetical protein
VKKFAEMLKENSLVRRIVVGLAFSAMFLCFVLCIWCFINLSESAYWLIGVSACGLLTGSLGGIAFHLAVIEEEE